MAIHKIIMQDLETNNQPIEIVSGDFLNFSKNHLITGINIVEDLLFWTDNFNQPRRINVETAINDPSYYDNEDKISVAKFAPYLAPMVYEYENVNTVSITRTQLNDANINSEYLKDKFVRFSYRYQFNEDEYSIFSPFTQIVFHPLNNGVLYQDPAVTYDQSTYELNKSTYGDPLYGTTKIVDTTEVQAMQNSINKVQLRIPLPNDNDYRYTSSHGVVRVTVNASNVLDGGLINGQIDPGTYIVKGYDTNARTEGVTQVTFDTTITNGSTIPSGTILDSGSLICSSGQQVVLVKMWENTSDIKKIDILIKESHQTAIKRVGELDINDTEEFLSKVDVYPVRLSSSSNIYWRYCVTYDYKSEKPIKVLPEQQSIRSTDLVPRIAKAQEVVSNRVVYGNFVQNYNIPEDSAGNQGINFIVESGIKGSSEYSTSPLTHGQLQHSEISYPYSSLKQRRTYKVGIVLSDRYGRKSPVISSTARLNSKTDGSGDQYSLGDTITIANDSTAYSSGTGPTQYSWSSDEDNIRGLNLQVSFEDSRFVRPADVYDADNNPFGWYSYTIVVQQLEQEYYNVYVPHPMSYNDSFATSSYITLYGGNINKVPRSTADNDINRNGIAGSEVFLFPKVIQNGSPAANASKLNDKDILLDVLNIGTRVEQGLESDGTHPDDTSNYKLVYKNEKSPLLADVINLDAYLDTSVAGASNALKGLTVFETEPFKSNIDIYYETSTSGLVKDLNIMMALNPASIPYNLRFGSSGSTITKSFPESSTGLLSSAYNIRATPGTSGNTLEYKILNIWDYKDNVRKDVKSKISINETSGALTIASNGFAFRNNDWDRYDLVVKVSEYNGTTYVGSTIGTLTLVVTNSNPTIGNPIGTAYLLIDEKSGVNLVDHDYTYNYTGTFSNGGTDETEKYLGCELSFEFNNNTTAFKDLYTKCFKLVQNTPEKGKFVLQTTKEWQDMPEQLRVNFFNNYSSAERAILVTITDSNNSTTATTTIYIAERESYKQVGWYLYPYYLLSFQKNSGVYNAFTNTYPDLQDNQTKFILKQGTSLKRVDKDVPRVNNVLYQMDGKSLAINQAGIENFILNPSKTNVDIPMVYKWIKNADDGSGKKEDIIFGYVIIDKDTSVIKKVVDLEPTKNTKAGKKLRKAIEDEGLLDSDFI